MTEIERLPALTQKPVETTTRNDPPYLAAAEQFGQTGTIGDRYRRHDIDANAIIDAAEALSPGAPVRHRKMAV